VTIELIRLKNVDAIVISTHWALAFTRMAVVLESRLNILVLEVFCPGKYLGKRMLDLVNNSWKKRART